ncbi:hypothetical protein [Hydrogenophaga sp.]|uniref:tyrosine-type recombinase/integrase n=1 Tax=Hydrogenophaga sp. TaxID=1904254 RepID=UPI0027174C90|nr:hypothetical protein [Hydrogenophaga sp.]MDO9131956.1 hypothetical protein [Hydrogenophaga sp.]
MASIQKVGDKWRAQVAKKGVRKSAMWGTKREAVQWADRVEAEIEAGLRDGMSFGQAADDYAAKVSPLKDSPKWERHRLNAFVAYFGPGAPLSGITTKEIGEWRNWRLTGKQPGKPDARPVSGSTVLREVNLLRNLFTVARKEWRVIDHNPFEGVRLPDENDSRHQVWRWQQIKRVLRADRDGKTAEAIKAFHIALHTALRLSEVLAGEYDARRRVMVLKRSKGEGARRVEVPITKRGAKLLPATFTVDPNEASVLFSRLTDQLLIEDLTFHDSRATALTLLSRRMDVMTLARISRHKDLNILQDTYYRERADEISARI